MKKSLSHLPKEKLAQLAPCVQKLHVSAFGGFNYRLLYYLRPKAVCEKKIKNFGCHCEEQSDGVI